MQKKKKIEILNPTDSLFYISSVWSYKKEDKNMISSGRLFVFTRFSGTSDKFLHVFTSRWADLPRRDRLTVSTIKLLIWKLVLHESERMRSPLWRDLSAWAVVKSSWDGNGRKRGETSHLPQRRQGVGNHCRVSDTGEGCQIVCFSVCFCVSVCAHLRSGCVLNDPAGCRVLAGDLRKWAGKMTEAKPGHKRTTKRIKIGFPGITVCAKWGMGGGVLNEIIDVFRRWPTSII